MMPKPRDVVEPFSQRPVGVTERQYWSILEHVAQKELQREPNHRDSHTFLAENLILTGTFNVRNVLTYTRNLYAYEEQVLDEIPEDNTLEWIAIWALGADIEAYSLWFERSSMHRALSRFDDMDED